MQFFKKTNATEIAFKEFIEKVEGIYESLHPYSIDIDISTIQKIKENFITKTEDFFREDRKLNIGVIGQVKAGKSSFLNTMIFDGMEVLPKASTPKTATLTKIEYSETNAIEVEYYTEEEWKSLEEKAKVDSELNEYVVAKEIMAMVKNNQIDPYSYINKGKEPFLFKSYEELMKKLNHYVGEDGEITPLVKSVTLKINNEDLKEISIVDTPGLNDPIASRTDKTKQFIEMCDVVFFLSRASGFLDKSDVDLLTAQLPQKGVKRLVLICSRYDDGLTDTIYDKGGLLEADVDTKHRLKRAATKTFSKVIEGYEARGASKELLSIIEECKKPVFVSSMAHNMSGKSFEQLNEEELTVYENLNVFDEVNFDLLKKIGNINQVKTIFTEVIDKKEETLLKKSSSFIPDASEELTQALRTMKETIERRLNVLVTQDQQELSNQKKFMNTQINNIRAALESVFSELYIKLEQSKTEALRDLRESSREYISLSEKTGTETKQGSYQVSTSKWYNPFSWGTSRTEYYTYEERYYYLDVSDALENIRNFSTEATNSIEDMFYRSIDITNLKRKLLQVIVENFDASDENYDPSYFKLLAEKTLQSIELPVIKLDVSQFLQRLASNFSGEIRDASSKSNLKSQLASTIGQLFEEITKKFIAELSQFKREIDVIKEQFADNLLTNINEEFNYLLQQFEDKEAEIEKGNQLLTFLNNKIK